MNKTHFSFASALITLSISISPIAGCATSNASYARTDSARSLTISEFQNAAQSIIDDILTSPTFAKMRSTKADAQGEMVVQVTSYDNRSGDRSTIPLLKGFFEYLEEYSTEKGITYSNDLGKTAAIRAQDADDNYDQSTGTVTTGAAAKSVIAIEIIFTSERSSGASDNLNEFVLRVKFIDAARATTLLSKSYKIEKR